MRELKTALGRIENFFRAVRPMKQGEKGEIFERMAANIQTLLAQDLDNLQGYISKIDEVLEP